MGFSSTLHAFQPDVAELAPTSFGGFQSYQGSQKHFLSGSPNHNEGDPMRFSRTKNGPTFRAESGPNNSDERSADLIFIQEWARTKSAKEGAALTGMTPSGFKKVQAGECAISYEKLTFAMKRDHRLAAMYFYHVGLLRPGEAETAAAYTQFANAVVRAGA
jgi:hypothetical protein